VATIHNFLLKRSVPNTPVNFLFVDYANYANIMQTVLFAYAFCVSVVLLPTQSRQRHSDVTEAKTDAK